MKRLMVYLTNYKKECVIAPAFKMLEALFDLFVPLVMANIIDVGIPAGDTGYIVRKCCLLILLGLIGLGCSIIAQYYAARALWAAAPASATPCSSTSSASAAPSWSGRGPPP